MSNEVFVAILMALVVVAYGILAFAAYIRMRGTHIVTCPETKQPAAVTVSAAHSALSGVFNPADVQLSACSRWSGPPRCDQACASQLVRSPKGTTAFQIVADWYAGKQCAMCGRDIPALTHFSLEAGLLDVESNVTVAWTDVPPEQLPKVLETHVPVCSSCHLTAWFRHEHPDLVVDRHRPQDTETSVH